MVASTHTRGSRTGRDGPFAHLQPKVAAWRRERDALLQDIDAVVVAAQSMLADVDGWSPRDTKRSGPAQRTTTRKRSDSSRLKPGLA